MKTTSRLLMMALLLVVPFALVAQEPPPAPPQHRGHGDFQGSPMHDPAEFAQHRLKRLTSELALTDDQQKQATAIFKSEADATTKLRDQMKTAHEALQKASKERNAVAIDQSAAAIGTLTAQMISTHEKSKLAFAKILSPDQLTKFDKLQADRAEHMHMNGWGPMHQRGPQHKDAPPAPSGGPGGLL